MKKYISLTIIAALLAWAAQGEQLQYSPITGGGSGTVTGVTGSSPIASSGGVAPAISCATCATTTNGGAISGTAPIAVNAAGVISGGGLGSVTGALKGNGSGTITQASCADLSNGAASCSTDTTTYTNITGNGNISTTGAAATADHTITSTSANCMAVGPNGITNPTLQANCNTASAVTGISVVGAAAGAGVKINGTSTGASEQITLASKGNGTVSLNVPTNNNAFNLNSTDARMSFSGTNIYFYTSKLSTLTPIMIGATKFTATGCSVSSTIGGGSAGKYTSGTTGTCTVVVTINGATGSTATNGWTCWANDETTPADKIQTIASTTTTATISGTTVSGDIISFGCIGF